MKIPHAAILIVLSTATIGPAHATDSICEAVFAYDTKETQDFPYAHKQGDVVDAITQYNVNKKTGVTSFCSHGGGCYPAEALRLTNCTIDKSKSFEDDDETSYGLDLIRSKVPPDKLRQNDVELRLLDLGLCNACADNAAAFYVKMPASRCAKLVLGALEGNPVAIANLKDFPDYCHE